MSRQARRSAMSAQPGIVRIYASGHANVSAKHSKSFEFTIDSDLTQSGTCIVGVAARADITGLLALRGAVSITLRCDGLVERIRARMNPYYIADDPLIIRTHAEPQHRSLCIGADKGAAALDRGFIAALRKPGAVLEATIEEMGRDSCTSGVLFVVGTPIGNRRDLSPRAEATLRSVDMVLAEDTRTTAQLLGKDSPPLLSVHDHNERQRVQEVLEFMSRGNRVALVSEAGMPLLSDPGYLIVQAAIAQNHLVVPLPGPDSVTSALCVSGLPVNDFRFVGFLPRKPGERIERLRQIGQGSYSTVIFESPNRVVDTLNAIAVTLGDRQVAACCNLTKPGEEILRGTASDLVRQLSERGAVRGEFTLVIEGRVAIAQNDLSVELRQAAESLVAAGVHTKVIVNALAEASGIPRRTLFATILAIKDAETAGSQSH